MIAVKTSVSSIGPGFYLLLATSSQLAEEQMSATSTGKNFTQNLGSLIFVTCVKND